MINFDDAVNIPSGEQRELVYSQEGILYYSENLKNGYDLVFNYYMTGNEKEKVKVVKRVGLPTINI